MSVSQCQFIAVFDAFGTVVKPVHGVVDTYHEFGTRFGSRLSREEIKSRFEHARSEIFGVGVNPDDDPKLPSNDFRERDMWARLISTVFIDVSETDSLFVELWDFFADPKNWTAYEDVEACFRSLLDTGFLIGIASNFDSRLLPIVDSLGLLHAVNWTYCSSQVGFRKPDRRFYEAIATSVESSLDNDVSTSLIMIGDDINNDVIAPRRLGWDAYHLDRMGTVDGSFRTLSDIANRIVSINDR